MQNDKIIKNGVNYLGFVRIKKLRGDKVVETIEKHNSGTIWLFKLLSSVLCGNDERLNMPRYFDIGILDQSLNSSAKFQSYLANRVFLSSKVINNFEIKSGNAYYTGKYGAVFTALISSINITENDAAKKANILRLYSESQKDDTLLAQVELTESEANNLNLNYGQGYNYMIEWVMTFENALEDSSSIN